MSRPILNDEAFAGSYEKLFARSVQQFAPRKRSLIPSEGHRWAIYIGTALALILVIAGL